MFVGVEKVFWVPFEKSSLQSSGANDRVNLAKKKKKIGVNRAYYDHLGLGTCLAAWNFLGAKSTEKAKNKLAKDWKNLKKIMKIF